MSLSLRDFWSCMKRGIHLQTLTYLDPSVVLWEEFVTDWESCRDKDKTKVRGFICGCNERAVDTKIRRWQLYDTLLFKHRGPLIQGIYLCSTFQQQGGSSTGSQRPVLGLNPLWCINHLQLENFNSLIKAAKLIKLFLSTDDCVMWKVINAYRITHSSRKLYMVFKHHSAHSASLPSFKQQRQENLCQW